MHPALWSGRRKLMLASTASRAAAADVHTCEDCSDAAISRLTSLQRSVSRGIAASLRSSQ